jgi:hypothetical protein
MTQAKQLNSLRYVHSPHARVDIRPAAGRAVVLPSRTAGHTSDRWSESVHSRFDRIRVPLQRSPRIMGFSTFIYSTSKARRAPRSPVGGRPREGESDPVRGRATSDPVWGRGPKDQTIDDRDIYI